MNQLKKSFSKSTLFLLFSKPGVYLKKLVTRTLIIGVATFIIGLTINLLNLESFKIPPSMHSLIGIVIGLLLVFRTNTAYDRWWDGRKTISLLASEIGMISARLNCLKDTSKEEDINEVRTRLDLFLTSLNEYLQHGHDGSQSDIFHVSQKRHLERTLKSVQKLNGNDYIIGGIYSSVSKLLEYSNTLERIKNTPIPLSYALHIKMSILVYLMSLPFGLFHELGLWATPFVMLVYYIIAGVEIISNEIENPFAKDPNDLPMDKLFNNISDTLWG